MDYIPGKMIENSKMTDCCQLIKITGRMSKRLFFLREFFTNDWD
jgi:hypothetical protein